MRIGREAILVQAPGFHFGEDAANGFAVTLFVEVELCGVHRAPVNGCRGTDLRSLSMADSRS